MLSSKITEVSEGIDVNNTSSCKQSIICYDWYFLAKAFKFQLSVCSGSHGVIMYTYIMSVTFLSNSVYENCIVFRINKSEAINLIKNADLRRKTGPL